MRRRSEWRKATGVIAESPLSGEVSYREVGPSNTVGKPLSASLLVSAENLQPGRARTMNQDLRQCLATAFVGQLAVRGLLEPTCRLESVVAAFEGSPFMRTFATMLWTNAFGDMVPHRAIFIVGDAASESLELKALDDDGRTLFRLNYAIDDAGRAGTDDGAAAV